MAPAWYLRSGQSETLTDHSRTLSISGGNKMATGDVKGGVRKLEQRLRLISYPKDVDYAGLVKGDPAASLPIISFTLTCYSTCVAEILVSSDIELTAKSDLRFIDSVYKVLRDIFNYKPILTKQQFLQCSFSERKIQIVCDIIDCVMKKHKEYMNQNKVKSQPIRKIVSVKEKCEVFYPEQISTQPTTKADKLTPKTTLVERHTGSDVHLSYLAATLPSSGKDDISCSSSDSECDLSREVVVTNDDTSHIELLKAQLAECQEKLQRLDWMEERLLTLETSMKGKIIIEETEWNNLLSRVLLLETDRLIRSKKRDLSSEFTAITEERTSSRMNDDAYTDSKTKADRAEIQHQSSGYGSLLSADTSPISIDINYSNLTADSKETTRQRVERIGKMLEETTQLLKISSSAQ